MLDVGREACAGKWEKEVWTSTPLQWGFLWQSLCGEWGQLIGGTEATKELLWLDGKNIILKRLPALHFVPTPPPTPPPPTITNVISDATGHPESGSLKEAFGQGG